MKELHDLKVKLFADGASRAGILDLYNNPLIQGFTTNPTLMHAVGLHDYEAFAREIIGLVPDRPISLEVFSDDFRDMERQAVKIASWGENVYVKIPVMNPAGDSAMGLIRDLAAEGVKLNVTAILTEKQIAEVAAALEPSVPSVVSVFAGRIADTGRDPVPVMEAAHSLLQGQPKAELLWASVREVYNIFQAEEARVHIVTVPHDILHKAITMCGLELNGLSLDTVRMFDRDAKAAGFSLATASQEIAEIVAAAMRKAA